jgi:hypothetical protein
MTLAEWIRKNALTMAICVAALAIVWGSIKTFIPTNNDRLIDSLRTQIARRDECIKYRYREQMNLAEKVAHLRDEHTRMKNNVDTILASIKTAEGKRHGTEVAGSLISLDSMFTDIAIYAQSPRGKSRDIAADSDPCQGL